MLIQKIRNMRGFTLIELMIVICIIGILAAIAIPNIVGFIEKQKAEEQKQEQLLKETERPEKLTPLK